jgi:hypothetical protein
VCMRIARASGSSRARAKMLGWRCPSVKSVSSLRVCHVCASDGLVAHGACGGVSCSCDVTVDGRESLMSRAAGRGPRVDVSVS